MYVLWFCTQTEIACPDVCVVRGCGGGVGGCGGGEVVVWGCVAVVEWCVCVCVCGCASVCVCVFYLELANAVLHLDEAGVCVCVCVCVCVSQVCSCGLWYRDLGS